MPDLGPHTVYVLSAYGVSIALLFGLVMLSLSQSRRVKAELRAVEARREAEKNA